MSNISEAVKGLYEDFCHCISEEIVPLAGTLLLEGLIFVVCKIRKIDRSTLVFP